MEVVSGDVEQELDDVVNEERVMQSAIITEESVVKHEVDDL